MITDFEEKLRTVILSNLTWEAETMDKGVVKIWYYTESDQIYDIYDNDKRKFPSLRFAITVININPIDDKKSNKIKECLGNTIITWIKKVQGLGN